MNDIVLKQGGILGKSVYASRNFKQGEIVIKYTLQPLTEEEFKNLSVLEKNFVHRHWGQLYLYSEPESYVNHSIHPNTRQDLKNQYDIAIRDIEQGEEITTDSLKDDIE